MRRAVGALGALGIVVLGTSCTTNPAEPLVHPRATSQVLGVRAAQTSATVAKFAYDPAQDASVETERLKEHVAHLRVEFSSGAVDVGSGVLICRTPRHAFLLTAGHVVDRSRAVDELGDPLEAAGELRSVTVSFYRDIAPVVELEPSAVAALDLHEDVALLRLASAWTDGLRPAALGPSTAISEGSELRTIGHASGDDRFRWYPRFPKVNDVGERVSYSPAVAAGFSGGPLFDDEGRLVAVNSHTLLDVDFSRAVRIERAIQAIGAALDPLCPGLQP